MFTMDGANEIVTSVHSKPIGFGEFQIPGQALSDATVNLTKI